MSFQKTSMPAGASNRCSSARIADLDSASRPWADPEYNASVRGSACEQTETNKRSAIALSVSDMVTLTPDYIGPASHTPITFLNTILSEHSDLRCRTLPISKFLHRLRYFRNDRLATPADDIKRNCAQHRMNKRIETRPGRRCDEVRNKSCRCADDDRTYGSSGVRLLPVNAREQRHDATGKNDIECDNQQNARLRTQPREAHGSRSSGYC